MREMLALLSLFLAMISAYYVARFAVRRRGESLCIAVSLAAWPALIARELKWLHLPSVAVLLGIGFCLAGLWLMIILRREANRPRPFQDWE